MDDATARRFGTGEALEAENWGPNVSSSPDEGVDGEGDAGAPGESMDSEVVEWLQGSTGRGKQQHAVQTWTATFSHLLPTSPAPTLHTMAFDTPRASRTAGTRKYTDAEKQAILQNFDLEGISSPQKKLARSSR